MVTSAVHECRLGWADIAGELQRAIARGRSEKPILVVECYPGVDERMILTELESRLCPALTIHAAEALLPPGKIDALVNPFLGGDDLTFDPHFKLSLVNFFSAEPLWRFRRIIDEWKTGLILVVGCGASLIAWGHILVYADLTRREAELRIHRHEAANLGVQNQNAPAGQRRKRAFFVDWRVADSWKRPLINRWDFALDTNHPPEPKLAEGEDVRRGLAEAARRPFRLGPSLDPTEVDSGRKIDCVPEENSLILGIGGIRFELPALDLVFQHPEELLGYNVPVSVTRRIKDTLASSSTSATFGHRLFKGHFIETQQCLFRNPVHHQTHGSVNVLNLLEGDEVVVESPADAFAPFIVHCAETFIVPAAVGEYTIRPHGPSTGRDCTVIKAFVRTSKAEDKGGILPNVIQSGGGDAHV